MNKFQIGDAVTAFGCTGTVHSFSSNGLYVYVKFDEAPSLVVFRPDGRMFGWAKEPQLRKV